jgi:hypothetical protein
MAVPDAVNTLVELSDALLSDVQTASRQLASAPIAYHRRQYVRSVFSLLDGMAYALKQAAHEGAAGFGVVFSLGEVAMIREETYDLDERGQAKSRPAYPRWAANMRFALDIVARAANVPNRADFGGAGWEALLRAVKLRNRLMHPKRPDDLAVSNEELRDVQAGLEWFRAHFGTLAGAIADAVAAKNNASAGKD